MLTNDFFIDGYKLMMEYITEQRIKTRERNFVRRLERFYNKHKDDNVLSDAEELEFLEFEKYFFNNIAKPENNNDKALVESLNIITSKFKKE